MAGTIGRVLFTKWTKAGFGEQLNWHGRLLERALNRSSAGPSRVMNDITTSGGHRLSAQALTQYGITEPAEIDALKVQIDALYNDLIDVPDQTDTQIMKHELVAGLGKLLLKNYEPTGNNVSDFKNALNADAQRSLVWASYNDSKELAVRLGKITGEGWDVQSNTEYEAARSELTGGNWTSTRTDHETYPDNKVFRLLDDDFRGNGLPECRFYDFAVRLVRTEK